MDRNRKELEAVLRTIAVGAGRLLGTAYRSLGILENGILEVLDQQMINRLMGQYDKLTKAGFNDKEALDAVLNLVKRRLETALDERR